MPQIRSLLSAQSGFPLWKDSHTRESLQSYILNLSIDEKSRLFLQAQRLVIEIDERKRTSNQVKLEMRRKRREEQMQSARVKRQKKMDGDQTCSSFPDIVEDSVRWNRLQLFNRHLSDEYVSQVICASCAGRFNKGDTSYFDIHDIPNKLRLQPTFTHSGHVLSDGMLLHTSALILDDNRKAYAYICRSCLSSLSLDRIPRLSLANNMWIGDVPLELSVLTLPEQILVSLYYPSAYVVKLFPKHPTARHWKEWDVNFGLRGNVSSYTLDKSGIQDMVQGNLMPRPPEILASLFSMTIVGPKGRPEHAIQGICQIRRARVLEALLWLKEHNAIYRDITIDSSVLSRLPESDIPYSISHNIKHVEENVSVDEADGFLGAGDYSDDEEFIQETSFHDNPSPADIVNDMSSPLQDPAVVALNESAVVDIDGFDISTQHLLTEAVENTIHSSPQLREPSYAVLRGSQFVNEYARRDEFGHEVSIANDDVNHLLGAFPVLFPYGSGGFETERTERVSYVEHARWALKYADGRFAKNISFLAQVFNVIQKRQVCLGAELQIRRSDYAKHERAINSVTIDHLKKAVEEEKRGAVPSNPGVRALKTFVNATRKHVCGTDESRIATRSKIHGMTIMNNPPNIWLTITCDDVNDPLVQILCGAEISLDRFDAALGPHAKQRLHNSTQNPFAATTFFFHMITLILEDLLGIKTSSRGKIYRQRGIFGTVQGYVGMIEAQGRGTLHLHILLWLCGSPSSSEMVDLLSQTQFRKRLERFISNNIKAHVYGLNSNYLAHETPTQKAEHKQRASAFSKPLQCHIANFDNVHKELEFSLVRTAQLHTCRRGACLFPDRFGVFRCKRRAPWDLSARDVVYESGLWYPEREHGYLNSWNPIILFATRSNNDIKLLTNANDTRHVTYYTTKYATKPQAKTYNATALLATRMAYLRSGKEDDNDLRKKNKKLLSQCAHTLSRSQELSSQQMVAYIMGNGDKLLSHRFVPIHLSGALWALENYFHEFRRRCSLVVNEADNEECARESAGSSTDTITDAVSSYSLRMTANGLHVKSQLSDYMWRGIAMESFTFLSFLLESYEPQSSEFNENTYRHERVPYHPQSTLHENRTRILRDPDIEMIPDFLGSWIPRNDREEDRDFYCACILLLFKPWRQLSDLKSGFDSWTHAFQYFERDIPTRTRRIIDNLQYYYRSSDAAAAKAEDEHRHSAEHDPTLYDDDTHDVSQFIPGIHFNSDNSALLDLDAIADNSESINETMFGIQAMNIAEDIGLFSSESDTWKFSAIPFQKSSMNLLTQNLQWQKDLEDIIKHSNQIPTSTVSSSQSRVTVASTIPFNEPSTSSIVIQPADNPSVPIEEIFSSLSYDQRRACEIVHHHLSTHLLGFEQDPLLMLICGSGGVGKSTVIRKIKETFEKLNACHLLSITATSGIAASHIDGHTVHWWAGLPIHLPKTTNFIEKSSNAINERREKNIRGKKYLIVDEVSMLCQETLGVLSHVIAHYSTSKNYHLPFGGEFNVILIGDFHQFPPPARSHLALFKQTPGKSVWASSGHEAFQAFQTVVLLTEQKRVIDPTWSSILERLRHGNCTADDIKEIQSLVLTHPTCRKPNFDTLPWNNAILVTPRHGVRNRWNTAAVKKFAEVNNRQLLISPVEYTFKNGDKINNQKHTDISIALAEQDKTLSKILPRKVYLAIGLRILLTFNIRVNADLANGTTGTITDIFLDPREPPVPSNLSIHQLQYPPSLLFFQPDNSNLQPLPGLPQGILPIQPSLQSFSIKKKDNTTVSLKRKQYPITPAYCFTDYKSQGQTISPVLLDLRKPPTGSLNQFNTYVALSRGTSREFTRILCMPDNSLFTTPSEYDLQIFDNRLSDLNEKTNRRHSKSSTIHTFHEA